MGGKRAAGTHAPACTEQPKARGVAAWKLPGVVLAAGCSGAASVALGLVAAVPGLGRREPRGSQLGYWKQFMGIWGTPQALQLTAGAKEGSSPVLPSPRPP